MMNNFFTASAPSDTLEAGDYRFAGSNVIVSNRYPTQPGRQVKRILMLDDNPIDHFIHLQLLKQHGCRALVTTVTTVEAAIAEMEIHAFDVIVTDMSLDGEVGLDLVAYLHAMDCPIPVVLLSSSRMTSDIEGSFHYPNVWAYMVKPLSETGIELLLSSGS